MRRVHLLVSLVASASLAVITACDSDSDAVSRQDCERLRDHLIDVRMQSVTADQDQHRIALRSALDDSFITSCVESTDRSYLHCALAATSSDALLACTEPSAH
jgi:hypothetical protein